MTFLQSKNHNLPLSRGFTLIELLVVATLLIVLATVGLVGFRESVIAARDNKRQRDISELQQSLELYYEDYKQYPIAGSIAQIISYSHMSDYLQSATIQDPVNRSPYLYTGTSTTNSFQLCYYKERTATQTCVSNVGQ